MQSQSVTRKHEIVSVWLAVGPSDHVRAQAMPAMPGVGTMQSQSVIRMDKMGSLTVWCAISAALRADRRCPEAMQAWSPAAAVQSQASSYSAAQLHLSGVQPRKSGRPPRWTQRTELCRPRQAGAKST